jgi:hypothetical protein
MDIFENKRSWEEEDKCWWFTKDANGNRRVLLNIHGYISGIDKHTIDPDGTVHPSVLVQTSEDGKKKEIYHDFIKLEGYDVNQ